MKICFFGVGGVGGYFGAILTNHYLEQHDIFFVARGKHKSAIQENGLVLKKSGGKQIIKVSPTFCTDNMHDLPVCDIVILSVKEYDLKKAAADLNFITDENTIILPLLNGIDIYERIRTQLSRGIVLRSCVYVGTHIEKPGVIYQNGGSCEISVGPDPTFDDYFPAGLLRLFKNSAINITWNNKIDTDIWSKYMFIAAYGLVTAANHKTLGEVSADEEQKKITKEIMNEINLIAQANQIELAADIIESSLAKASQFPSETRTSFQRDIETRRPVNEADLYGGTIIRMGKKFGIPTHYTEKVFKKIYQGAKS